MHHQPYQATSLALDGSTSGYRPAVGAGSAQLELQEGTSSTLVLNMAPDYLSNADLSFTSDDEGVATVNENGLVSAIAAGKAIITAAAKSGGATAANRAAVPKNDPGVAAAIKIPVTVSEAPLLSGFVSDVDTQWTLDRYGEAVERAKATDGEATTAKLVAWKNDAALSEITLASGACDVSEVSVEATDFTGANGARIAAENVELSFIGSTKAYNGSILGYGNQSDKYPTANDANRSESNDVLLGAAPPQRQEVLAPKHLRQGARSQRRAGR